MTIQPKAIEQYFRVVLYIIWYKMVLTFKSVDETLVCDHSNETIEQYFHLVMFFMLNDVALTFKYVDETLVCEHSNKSY